jgi:8-oxo-dGTP pyrophosphatase MutT (NUDIX family)
VEEGAQARLVAEVIEAAGGIPWREAPDGTVEVLIVRRTRYGDWTFPKGKAEPGDRSAAETAAREVYEETGYRCSLGGELITTEYADQKGRPKRVRYWAMQVVDGAPISPNDEIDEVRWVPLSAVGDLLTYDNDRRVLAAFTATLARDA